MDKKYLGMIILAVLLVGSVTYQVVDTGEEIVCRTGDGWTVTAEHDGYYEAECQYLTKDWLKANCSGFRSTASKERYGCSVVELVVVEEIVLGDSSVDTITCTKEGCTI